MMVRHVLPLAALVLTACPAPGDSGDSAEPGLEPFTLIVLPDTQYVALGYPEILEEMLGWAATQDAAFLLHEGDLTHENSEAEWSANRAAFDLLEGRLPYALCLGNHDEIDDEEHAWFDATFPLADVEDEPWFGGHYRPDSRDSAWYVFEGGGVDWLIIALTYGPDDDELAWASGVLDEHPDHRVIVLTHAYLLPDGTLSNPGIRIWNALEHHPGLSFVFNGHYTAGEAARKEDSAQAGNAVHQLFFNMQDRPIGGQGLLRTLRFDPQASTVEVQTYSPWLDWLEPGDDHQFALEGVDLGAP